MRGLAVGSLGGIARTLSRAATVCTYAAAGLLTRAGLACEMEHDWRDFGVRQSEQDVSGGLFSWEKAFFMPHLRPADRILVVGCGTGRDLLALLDLGYRADGLEPVRACAVLAEQRLAARGLSSEVITGPIETAPLTARFDVFVFSWFCYGYIPERARRIAMLERVKAALAPQGRILISYIAAEPPPRRILSYLARATAWASRSDRRPEYGDVYIARGDGRIHFEHHFRPDEIEAEAAAAGLRVTFHDTAGDGNVVFVNKD